MKNYISFMLLLINFSLYSQISNNGLLAYYPFDNNVQDLSPNAFNGALSGGNFGDDENGNPNAALQLNGTNEYLNLSSFGNTFRNNLDLITITFKVKFEKVTNNQVILSLGNQGENLNTNVFEIEYENSRFQVETERGNNAINHELELDQSSSFFDSGWHSVVIEIENDIMTYCRDGIMIYQGVYIPATSLSNDLFIGCFGGTSAQSCCFFGGYIDELQFYDRVLTQSEINTFCGSSSGECDIPTNIHHELLAPAKCNITWSSISGALKYDIHYRKKGINADWTRLGTYNSTRSIYYLEPNTIYEYFVRASCDNTWSFANSSQRYQFNTANIPQARKQENEFENSISLYPNPAKEFFLIRSEHEHALNENIIGKIFSIDGKEVKSFVIKNNDTSTYVDVSSLEKGIYVVQYGSTYKKIIVE